MSKIGELVPLEAAACDYQQMGLIWNRRKRLGKNTNVNVSKGGVSASRKAGPVSVNSRGRTSIRLGKGLRFKI